MRELRIAAWCTATTTTGLVVVGALRLARVLHGHGEEIPMVAWVAPPLVAVATRTLESHASRIQRKLEEAGLSGYVNVWGVGRRLVAGGGEWQEVASLHAF